MMKGQAILFSKQSDEWESPDVLVKLCAPYIYHDVCATKENAKCESFWCKADDGLSQDWNKKASEIREKLGLPRNSKLTFWMNPPHSKISDWIDKAYNNVLESNGSLRVISLLPARTDTRWFHTYIYGPKVKIRFIRGRVKFSNNKNPAPFPSMIVYFGEEEG